MNRISLSSVAINELVGWHDAKENGPDRMIGSVNIHDFALKYDPRTRRLLPRFWFERFRVPCGDLGRLAAKELVHRRNAIRIGF